MITQPTPNAYLRGFDSFYSLAKFALPETLQQAASSTLVLYFDAFSIKKWPFARLDLRFGGIAGSLLLPLSLFSLPIFYRAQLRNMWSEFFLLYVTVVRINQTVWWCYIKCTYTWWKVLTHMACTLALIRLNDRWNYNLIFWMIILLKLRNICLWCFWKHILTPHSFRTMWDDLLHIYLSPICQIQHENWHEEVPKKI